MHTTETMKARCIEAMETWKLMRVRVGPSSKSGFWPLIPGEMFKDYAPETTRIIRLPTAAEIGRADEFTAWVNRHLDETERKEIWLWGRLKVSQNRTIRGYCEKIGLREHEYRRKINSIFMHLSRCANGDRFPDIGVKPSFHRAIDIDDREQITKRTNFWRSEDLPSKGEQIRSLVQTALSNEKTRELLRGHVQGRSTGERA